MLLLLSLPILALTSSIPDSIPILPNPIPNSNSSCYCLPQDPCWPSLKQWSQFNHTIAGALIATIPLASPCHSHSPFTPYNAAQCAAIRNNWPLPSTHYKTSSSIMAPFFANQSCDPFLPASSRCILGTYVAYAVRVSSPSTIKATLAFARTHNIRLVIRNTGHDYLGKSTGAGALAIWTHHLSNITVHKTYHSGQYTGPALTVGAGVQVYAAAEAAHSHNLVVVGANAVTAGLAGGYSQGGGHSQLTSTFGLAADQVLHWEVVLPETGQLVTAAPTGPHADLYWALCGGGGGVHAIVVSMTVKAHPELRTASANLSFVGGGVSFRRGVDAFVKTLPCLLDARCVVVWLLADGLFSVTPVTLPAGDKESLGRLMGGVVETLKRENVSYSYYINDFPTYHESFNTMSPPLNITEYNIGGRLIPRSVVEFNASAFTDTLWDIVRQGGVISGITVNATLHNHDSNGRKKVENAVLPAWRTAAANIVVALPFNYTSQSTNLAHQSLITHTFLPALDRLLVSPSTGAPVAAAAYLNEANFREPHWQSVFYGSNYPRLLAIKNKYDPRGVLYAATGVGSEAWVVEESDGRLCRV
ncbi:FAD/FMN-containing dehydrogenase [Aspergillus campestris IBT 28561]|uniref:FAD/FMN-containing dehydrogenase n=1 Tax=Aspergillus campestris (strain IBT 28561) TaxID=1392248 RepID=A0A2I1DDL6_ASPC2|nr:FAD/FMN-containing dehydrogenase [Aspergillus campestris IBT 28561]PKY07955.1 FAD/FMN-containing dehydrogenase [Aspergillus campestris IBT 28561]